MSRKQTAPGAVAATTEAKDEEKGTPSQTMVADSVTDRARRRMARALAWVGANPQAWTYVEREALSRASEGARVSPQELFEFVRWHDFTDAGGGHTTVDNTLIPALSRILTARHPELSPLVERRASAYDGLCGEVAR